MPKQSAYKKELIKQLYFLGAQSSSDLSIRTDKSIPLIVRLISELIDEKIIVESGLATSTGGRRPQVYSLVQDLAYIVCVSMDQMVTRIAMVDMNNNYVGDIKRVSLVLANHKMALDELVHHITGFIKESGVPKHKIIGIGVGMPGFVDIAKGINHSFLQTGSDKSVVETIEATTGLRVFIDNDSSLIALAELRFAAAAGKQNVMVINIGWGIGLGIIINGELFRGNNGFAGEFSHIPLFTNNKLCACGKTGCLETEASLAVIAEKAIEGIHKGRVTMLSDLSLDNIEETSEKIMKAALKGDKFAVELLSEAGYHIGRAIAILIHLLNPELIILSGRGSVAGKLWLTPVQQAIHEHCIPNIAENTNIEISTLRGEAELIGAAALVMEHYDELDKTPGALLLTADK
ncbi:MAG: ROK family protein [Williamsia sp.]|nr:ROK family protein [Williamsia sp.]